MCSFIVLVITKLLGPCYIHSLPLSAGHFLDWKQIRFGRAGMLKLALVCLEYMYVSLILSVCSLQRDVTYEEAKKFADENGKHIEQLE